MMRLVSEMEREKYAGVWQRAEYAEYSPGASAVDWLFETWPLPPPRRVVDVGCGAGAAALKFIERGCEVTLVDLCLDAVADSRLASCPRIESAAWYHWPVKVAGPFDLAFCVDVLEHLPPEFTMLTVDRLLEAAEFAFVQVSNVPARFSSLAHAPLHLTVEPYEWWFDRLRDLDAVMIEARDCLQRSAFLLRRS